MRFRLTVLAVAVVTLAACGNGDEDVTSDTSAPQVTTTPTDVITTSDESVVYVALGDSGKLHPEAGSE